MRVVQKRNGHGVVLEDDRSIWVLAVQVSVVHVPRFRREDADVVAGCENLLLDLSDRQDDSVWRKSEGRGNNEVAR